MKNIIKLTDKEFLSRLNLNDEMLPCYEIDCPICKNANYHAQFEIQDPTTHRKCFDNYMDKMKAEKLKEILT